MKRKENQKEYSETTIAMLCSGCDVDADAGRRIAGYNKKRKINEYD